MQHFIKYRGIIHFERIEVIKSPFLQVLRVSDLSVHMHTGQEYIVKKSDKILTSLSHSDGKLKVLKMSFFETKKAIVTNIQNGIRFPENALLAGTSLT